MKPAWAAWKDFITEKERGGEGREKEREGKMEEGMKKGREGNPLGVLRRSVTQQQALCFYRRWHGGGQTESDSKCSGGGQLPQTETGPWNRTDAFSFLDPR